LLLLILLSRGYAAYAEPTEQPGTAHRETNYIYRLSATAGARSTSLLFRRDGNQIIHVDSDGTLQTIDATKLDRPTRTIQLRNQPPIQFAADDELNGIAYVQAGMYLYAWRQQSDRFDTSDRLKAISRDSLAKCVSVSRGRIAIGLDQTVQLSMSKYMIWKADARQ
jgi:hypothetical protein